MILPVQRWYVQFTISCFLYKQFYDVYLYLKPSFAYGKSHSCSLHGNRLIVWNGVGHFVSVVKITLWKDEVFRIGKVTHGDKVTSYQGNALRITAALCEECVMHIDSKNLIMRHNDMLFKLN